MKRTTRRLRRYHFAFDTGLCTGLCYAALPCTLVGRACKPDATYSHGKGVWCHARRQRLRQSRDGLRRSPSVRSCWYRPALSTRACRGWRTKGPGDSAGRRRAVKARTRQSVVAKGHPQLCATAAHRKRVWSALHARCARRRYWASSVRYKMSYKKNINTILERICLA